ncbi:hypothetical protein ACFQ0B_42335 [Nonomuraea thailandensis]
MRYGAAVEVGIAAFRAGEEPPRDEEVWRRSCSSTLPRPAR